MTIRGAQTPSRDQHCLVREQVGVKVLETTRGMLHAEGACVLVLPLVTLPALETARVAALRSAGVLKARPRSSWVSHREGRTAG